MEATQEGEDCGASAFACAKEVSRSVRILCIHAPVAGKEGQQTCGVRHDRQEVIPTDVLTTRLRNSNVYQVTRPSDGTEAEQASQVVVQPGFRILEPAEAGAEFGLKV